MKKVIVPILLTTLLVSISEFVRNQFLLQENWTKHYADMGQSFPAEPLNGAVWGIWSLVFALVIFVISKKYTLLQTFILSWVIGFVMMWLVIGNLGVLPYSILPIAIPLSLLEAGLAAWICKKFG